MTLVQVVLCIWVHPTSLRDDHRVEFRGDNDLLFLAKQPSVTEVSPSLLGKNWFLLSFFSTKLSRKLGLILNSVLEVPFGDVCPFFSPPISLSYCHLPHHLLQICELDSLSFGSIWHSWGPAHLLFTPLSPFLPSSWNLQKRARKGHGEGHSLQELKQNGSRGLLSLAHLEYCGCRCGSRTQPSCMWG